MALNTKDEFLTAKQVAELLEVSQSWLEHRRRRGDGPPFIRLSPTKGVRYPAREFERWLAKREVRRAVAL